MRLHVLGMAIALAACVSSAGRSRKTASNTASGSELVCKEEVPTGTSLSRTVCRTPEQIEDDRIRAEQMLRMPSGRAQPR